MFNCGITKALCLGKCSLLPLTSFLKTGLSLCCLPCVKFVWERKTEMHSTYTYKCVQKWSFTFRIFIVLCYVRDLFSVNLRRIKCFCLFLFNRRIVSCLLTFFTAQNILRQHRDTVRLHPSISFLFPLCPTAGKREHLNIIIIFIMNTEKLLTLVLFTFFCLFVSKCLLCVLQIHVI